MEMEIRKQECSDHWHGRLVYSDSISGPVLKLGEWVKLQISHSSPQ